MIDPDAPQSEPTVSPRRLVGCALAGVGVLLTVALLPNHHGPTRAGSEAQAITSLRALSAAQLEFRDDDLDRDGVHDDATSLAELRQAGLIDDALASGLRRGYAFTLRAGPHGDLPRWITVASPENPGVTGDRHFRVDASGEVHASTTRFALDPDAPLPPDAARAW